MSLEELLNQEKAQMNGKDLNAKQVQEELNEIKKQNALLRDRMILIEESQESRNKHIEKQIQALEDTKVSLNSNNKTLGYYLKQLEKNKNVDVVINEDISDKILDVVKTNYESGKVKLVSKREQELERALMALEDSLEKTHEKVKHTNKFFYPVLYGAFIAIVGFIVLFLLQGIIGNLFGESYYPMIATKVEQSTGFNTFMWYLAYLGPYILIAATIIVILKLFIKKGSSYL